MFSIGDVFLFKNYVFPDGTVRPQKILIFLNGDNSLISGNLAYVVTTSNYNRFPQVTNQGCHDYNKSKLFLFAGNKDDKRDFNKQTFVDLSYIPEKSYNYFFNKERSENLIFLFNMKSEILKELLYCCISSEDISFELEDVLNSYVAKFQN